MFNSAGSFGGICFMNQCSSFTTLRLQHATARFYAQIDRPESRVFNQSIIWTDRNRKGESYLSESEDRLRLKSIRVLRKGECICRITYNAKHDTLFFMIRGMPVAL